MKILDYEIDFDFTDADNMEKVENSIEKAKKGFENINETNKKTSEVIRETCNIVFDCFNEIFGKDTNKKIFGNKCSLKDCMKAFDELAEGRVEQEKEFQNDMQKIESKYNPNRATRRKK